MQAIIYQHSFVYELALLVFSNHLLNVMHINCLQIKWDDKLLLLSGHSKNISESVKGLFLESLFYPLQYTL